MWVFTTRGFYSVVNKHGDPADVLTVRARVKKDLENLSDLLPEAKPYEEEFYTDYAWRIKVTAAEWAKVMAVLALDIDYDNFKDEVKRVQGTKRAGVYGGVWGKLLALQPYKAWNSASSLFDWERVRVRELHEQGKTPAQIRAAIKSSGLTTKMVAAYVKTLKAKEKKKSGGKSAGQKQLPVATKPKGKA